MNLKIIMQNLPNGFHDSYIHKIEIDVISNFIGIDLNVWIDEKPVNGQYEGKYRRAKLLMRDIKYFIFENDCFTKMGRGDTTFWIDIDTDYSRVQKPGQYIEGDNSGWIYFNDQNSFAHFCAGNFNFQWENQTIK